MSIFARRGGLQDFFYQTPVTSVIVIINTIFFIVTLVTGGFMNGEFMNWGYINKVLIFENGEYYRLITGAFLHWDFLHFGGNVILGLVVLSSALERVVGSKKFSIIYFGSLIISSVLIAYLSDPEIRTAGASGAIFGVLGCLLWLTAFRRDLLNYRDVQSIWVLCGLNIFMTFATPGISIIGHVAGIASGFAISFLLIQRDIFKVLE